MLELVIEDPWTFHATNVGMLTNSALQTVRMFWNGDVQFYHGSWTTFKACNSKIT